MDLNLVANLANTMPIMYRQLNNYIRYVQWFLNVVKSSIATFPCIVECYLMSLCAQQS